MTSEPPSVPSPEQHERNRPAPGQQSLPGTKKSPSGVPIPEHLSHRMTFDDALIPEDLMAHDHWVLWSYDLNEKGKWTKVPLYINEAGKIRRSSSKDPSKWMPYTFAAEQARIHGLGVSFMTSSDEVHGDPFLFIDIDLPADHPEVRELIISLGTYTEISPSGQGVRMILRGKKPTARCRRGPYEVYDTGQPLTITGNQVPGTNLLIAETGDAFDQFFATYIDQGESTRTPVDVSNFTVTNAATTVQDVLAQAANDGLMGTRLRQLFEKGSAEGYTQKDRTVRDLYFMTLAAKYTGANAELLDTFFRESALAREPGRLEKWNRNSRENRTYGANTIDRAIERAAENHAARAGQVASRHDPDFSDSPVHTLP